MLYNEVEDLIEKIIKSGEIKIPWREVRGYMLTSYLEYNIVNSTLSLIGVWRGKGIHANQNVHITNY